MDHNEQVAAIVEASKQAVLNVFESMILRPVSFLEMVKCTHGSQTASEGVVGIIGMGGGFKGSIGVGLTSSFGRTLVKAMLGMDEASDSDILDIAGELANLVAGSVKTNLEKKIDNFSITCPTVLCGNVRFPLTQSQEAVLLKFKSDEEFYVVIVSTHK